MTIHSRKNPKLERSSHRPPFGGACKMGGLLELLGGRKELAGEGALLGSRRVAEPLQIAADLLGEACGAQPDTFSGLAGMGDLIVTCFSGFGRNRRAGEQIARGRSADEAAAEIGQVVEGLTTAPVLRDLSRRLGVELPITEGVCRVLGGEPIHALLASLMGRQPTQE